MSGRVVISPKQYLYMTDLMSRYVEKPCTETDRTLIAYQEEIDWPWRATQGQLDDWGMWWPIWDAHLSIKRVEQSKAGIIDEFGRLANSTPLKQI